MIFRNTLIAAVVVFALCVSASAKIFPPDPAGAMLPDKIGGARATKPVIARGLDRVDVYDQRELTSLAEREYLAAKDRRFLVSVGTSSSDSQAYARFTRTRTSAGGTNLTTAAVGTDAFYFSNSDGNFLQFFKGNTNVSIRETGTPVRPGRGRASRRPRASCAAGA